MSSIPNSWRTAQAAVNALRSLLNRHNHIVHEIDGKSDFGEDLYVTFSEHDHTTGDMVKVQVKGGKSWRRKYGYGVPVAQHANSWSNGNVPVLCVIHDSETDKIYWANATKQLLAAQRSHTKLSTIRISTESILDDSSISEFVSEVRQYVGRYRGNQSIRNRLAEMSDVEFERSDLVQHFVNECGEDLVFWQKQGEDWAVLLHSDGDWEPWRVRPEMLHIGIPIPPGISIDGLTEDMKRNVQRLLDGICVINGFILNKPEALWLAACFEATEWARGPQP